MRTARAAALGVLLFGPGLAAADGLAVIAVGEPPEGPGPALAALTHGLRDACRDRAAGVMGLAALRDRLVVAGPPLGEPERACAEAAAALEAGDAAGAERRLRAALAALERAPERRPAFALWTEAMARLAWAQRVAGRPADGAATLERLAAAAPDLALDEVRYPPSLRAELAAAGARVRARPATRLTVRAGGQPATVFLDGREVGAAPFTLTVPRGRHRIGGVLDGRRLPPAWVDLAGEARAVELDAALAMAVRPDAGPGLAASPAARGSALARLGAWLGARRLIAARLVAEDGGTWLEAALQEPPGAAPRRAGRVRLANDAASAGQLGALASYLLGGPASDEVVPVPPPGAAGPALAGAPSAPSALSAPALPAAPAAAAPSPGAPSAAALLLTGGLGPAAPAPALPALAPAAAPREEPVEIAQVARASAHPWARPAAYATGAAAVLLAGFTVWQALAARSAYGEADAMLLPDGTYVPGATAAGRQQALADGAAASRNAYLGAAGTLVLAGAAVLFGHLAADERGVTVLTF